MKKLSLVLLLAVASLGSLMAQRTISGTVTDQDGEPLIGASILILGTTSGTVTDIDGTFSVDVPESATTLVVSYTGFETQEILLGSSDVVNIELTEGVTIDEVVVTAVGLESNRRALGYSIQNLQSDEVTNAMETNLVNALNAKVAGVNVTSSTGVPGASASVRIRGANSISRTTQPLFVIDGVPIDNNEVGNGVGGVDQSNRAIDINPNDIANLTVLKGAAATALYGVRAANGAILITTKKGATGAPRVNLTASYAWDQVNKLPDYQTTYAQGRPVDGVPTWRGPHTLDANSWGPAISDLEFSTDPNHPNAPPASQFDPDGNYQFDRNGFLVPRGTGNGNPAVAYDPYDFFVTGNTYDVNFDIQGGSEKVRYFFSMGRNSSEGIVPKSRFTRNSIRLSTDVNLTKKLTAGFSANYVNSGGRRLERGSNLRGIMLGLLRNTPTFDIGNGKTGRDAANDPTTYIAADGTQRSYRNGIYDNPYWVVNKNFTEDNVNRVIGYITAGYEFTDWLKLTYKVGIDYYAETRDGIVDIVPNWNPGSVAMNAYTNTDINSDLLLQFKKTFGEKFDLGVVVGHNYFTHSFLSQNTDGFTLAAPDFLDISNASDVQSSRGINEYKLVGAFATADIAWDDWAFLNLTFRNDWSSRLPEDANTFQSYSASLGIALMELLNLESNPIMPYLKLRGSYGVVGNDAPVYSTTNYFNSALAGGDGFISGVQFPAFGLNAFERSGVLGNDQIVPERTSTWEFGGEAKFWQGRIGLDVTYYNALTEDIILTLEVSGASGFGNVVSNAARIRNTGWEIFGDAELIRRPNFVWNLGVNFTAYENTVEELAPGISEIGLSGFVGSTSSAVAGEPYGALYGDGYQKDENGNTIIGANGFPLQDPNEKVLADPNPEWFAGLRNTFTFFGVSLSVLFDRREGGDMWCGTCGVMDYFGTSQLSADTRDQTIVFPGVLEDGTPNNIEVPYADPAGGINSYFFVRYGFGGLMEQNIFETSWWRLREASISYAFPKSLVEKMRLNSLSVSFIGRNLWLQTDYPGVDPETNLTGTSNGFGLDYFNNPNTRSYNLVFRLGI